MRAYQRLLPWMIATSLLSACGSEPAPSAEPIATAPIAAPAEPEPPTDPVLAAVPDFKWSLPEDALRVDARMSVYLAGQASPPADPLYGMLPLALPVEGASAFEFPTIEGRIGCASAIEHGPDGGTCVSAESDITPANGFSGMRSRNRTMFLVGVFAQNPDPAQVPETLTAPEQDLELEVRPVLNQVFLIGDGRTQDQQLQRVMVPEGADTLYLGFADAAGFFGDPGYYEDNVGYLRIAATRVEAAAAPSEPAGTAESGDSAEPAAESATDKPSS